MGLSRTVSEVNAHPLYFAPPPKGFLLELGIGAGDQKTRMMDLPGRERSLTVSSAVTWYSEIEKNVMSGNAT